MKKVFIILTALIVFLLFYPVDSKCQYPPHQSDVPAGAGHGPVGCSGPIGGGLFILLTLGSGYALNQYLRVGKNRK